MKALRFYGETVSVKGRIIRAEIWKEKTDTDTWTAEEMELSEDPFVIEWDDKDKTDPVKTSHATLTLNSETDRKYIELYSIKWDDARLDIYIDGVLYWSGMLDPEVYEEPYSYEKNYDVILTFSDLAGLDRKNFSGSGLKSIMTLFSEIITASGLNLTNTVIKATLCWGTDDGGETVDFNDLYIDSGNWFDEDGEAMSLYKILEEILKAFSLGCEQRGGVLYIYDLEGLRTTGKTENVNWSDTDSVLGVDKVLNNVKVTFSPYGNTTLLDQGVSYQEDSADETFTIPLDGELENNSYKNPNGFTLRIGDGGEGLIAKNGAKYFKTTPLLSGDTHTGVLLKWQRFRPESYYPTAPTQLKGLEMLGTNSRESDDHTYSGYYNLRWHEPTTDITAINALKEIVRTKKVYVPYLHNTDYKLRMKTEILFDFVLNPFEGSGKFNVETDNLINGSEEVNYIYIPVKIRLWNNNNDESSLLEGYTLETPYANDTAEHSDGDNWTKASAAVAVGYLCFYDASNIDHGNSLTGGKGFANNKWMIGFTTTIPSSISKLEAGEYLKMPYEGGWMDIAIMDGIYMLDAHKRRVREDYNGMIVWYLIKNISIELVDQYGNSIDTEDVEDKAYINTNAKEGENVDTIVGTSGTLPPSCLGLLKRADYTVVDKLKRAGTEDSLSHLIINNYYSQYADRCFKITGTAELPEADTLLFSEAVTAGIFMRLGSVENLCKEESELHLVQLKEEHYCSEDV